MKNRILISLLTVLLFSPMLFADADNVGRAKDPAAYLKLGLGGRSIGMGRAYASVAEDVSAIYWNPAGLAQLSKYELQAMSGVLGFDRSLYSFAVAAPIRFSRDDYGLGDMEDPAEEARQKFLLPLSKWRMCVSAGAMIFRIYNIERRNDFGVKQGEFANYEYTYFFSVGHDVFTNLMMGYTFKYHTERLEESTAKGRSVDVGALYHSVKLPGLRIALTFLNLGSQFDWKAVDTVGANYEYTEKINRSWKIAGSYHFKNPNLLLAVETESFSQQLPVYRAGIEFKPVAPLALRAGVDNQTPSMGVGFMQKAGSRMEILVDYAFVTAVETLTETHRISVALRY